MKNLKFNYNSKNSKKKVYRFENSTVCSQDNKKKSVKF